MKIQILFSCPPLFVSVPVFSDRNSRQTSPHGNLQTAEPYPIETGLYKHTQSTDGCCVYVCVRELGVLQQKMLSWHFLQVILSRETFLTDSNFPIFVIQCILIAKLYLGVAQKHFLSDKGYNKLGNMFKGKDNCILNLHYKYTSSRKFILRGEYSRVLTHFFISYHLKPNPLSPLTLFSMSFNYNVLHFGWSYYTESESMNFVTEVHLKGVMWSPSQIGGFSPVSSHTKTTGTQTSVPTRMINKSCITCFVIVVK